MIRHVVLMRVPQANLPGVSATVQAIGALEGLGIQGFVASANLTAEHRHQGYNYGFILDFADWPALERYQAHPEHQRQGTQLLSALENPNQDLLVFDMRCRLTGRPGISRSLKDSLNRLSQVLRGLGLMK